LWIARFRQRRSSFDRETAVRPADFADFADFNALAKGEPLIPSLRNKETVVKRGEAKERRHSCRCPRSAKRQILLSHGSRSLRGARYWALRALKTATGMSPLPGFAPFHHRLFISERWDMSPPRVAQRSKHCSERCHARHSARGGQPYEARDVRHSRTPVAGSAEDVHQ
jgi:hypothetical protein